MCGGLSAVIGTHPGPEARAKREAPPVAAHAEQASDGRACGLVVHEASGGTRCGGLRCAQGLERAAPIELGVGEIEPADRRQWTLPGLVQTVYHW